MIPSNASEQVKTFGNMTYEIIPRPLWEDVLLKCTSILALSLFVFAVNLVLNSLVVFVCGKVRGLVKRDWKTKKKTRKRKTKTMKGSRAVEATDSKKKLLRALIAYTLLSLALESIVVYVLMYAVPYYPAVSEALVGILSAVIIYFSFMHTVGKRMENRELACMIAIVLAVCTNPAIGFAFHGALDFIGASGLVVEAVKTIQKHTVTVIMHGGNATLLEVPVGGGGG